MPQMHSPTEQIDSSQIPVGISACLLGEKVRYNGGHKKSDYCMDVLSELFKYRPFCPEVGIGMSTPRQAIRLVGDPESPRVKGSVDPELDVTDQLYAFGKRVAEKNSDLCGFIVTKKSPSCGMERVKVYSEKGFPNGSSVGLSTRAIMETNPTLPVEEDGRLLDPILRENFITRVYVLHQWKQLLAASPDYHALIQFHSQHKYLLMAHSYKGYKELGSYLATANKQPLDEVLQHYIKTLMHYLSLRATRKSHTNVMMHILGYMKKVLDSECKQELLDCIDTYRKGEVHLVVPMTMLKHYLKRHGNDYIKQQVYLDPYPHQLGLRNYI